LLTWITTHFQILLIGFGAGLVPALLILTLVMLRNERRYDALDRQYTQILGQHAFLKSTLAERENALDQSRDQAQDLQRQLSQYQAKVAGLSAQMAQLQSLQDQLTEKDALLTQTREALRLAENQLADLKARAESEAAHHAAQLALLQDAKEQLSKEFSVVANAIFEQKQRTFSEASQQSLTALLDPFNKQIEQFRKRVDDIHTQDTQGRSQLLAQLGLLKELNSQLHKQAGDLTRALKGDKKLQGNWGELQLERILESAGLQQGREFEREPNFKDEQGRNRRPDFIIHLPEGKHIIVDSKVSLNAYQAVVGAENDRSREQSLREHVGAIRQHIRNLSDKNYPALPALNAPDFVLMFMPIESAFIAAFETDPSLFNEAFERHIVVVTPTTLLATLRTVANLWSLERQNENAKELYALAGKIYDKVAVFSHKMEKLGQQISGADKSFHDAMSSLTEGRGSMISYVNRLKDYGAPVSKTLAPSFGLERDTGSEDPEPANGLDALAKNG
jgi:DNA recombination protein RmuC